MRLKIGSLIGLIFLVMVIMTGCTGGKTETAQEVFDAYNNGDTKKAQQIYSEEIQGNEENEKAFDEKLNQVVKSIIESYNEEAINIDIAQEQISHYVDVFGERICLMDGYENLKVIQSSKASYEKARKLDEKEQYAKAYFLYESVSEKDSNYEDAQKRMDELSEILAEKAEQGKAATEQYMEEYEESIKSWSRQYTPSQISGTSTGNSSSGTVTQEYKNALSQAIYFATRDNLSKKAIYNQLTSDYGGQFPADAAQYAINNLTGIDWNANALAQAEYFYTRSGMSKSAIYDQLTSEYGGQFTASEAQYAIDHLD